MEAIEHYNNKDVKLLFVPCHTDLVNDNSMTVINNVPVPLMFRDNKAQEIYDSVIESGEKIGNNSLAASGKRSNHSFSIGLQTMYAHQQHCARYCMLPHSRPHVTNAKKYPKSLGDSILHAYGYVESILSRVNNINKQHLFKFEQLPTRENAAEVVERLKLRNDLLTYFSNQRSEEDEQRVVLPAREAMFEACTIQPTDALGFHKDTMNCSNLDNTIALIVPTNVTSATGNEISLSYLFYTRKCVGHHANKISLIHHFISDDEQCDLARFCVRSIMNVGGVYDYQSSLFEAQESLNFIALRLEGDTNHRCEEIKQFSGLGCFKHGAAFDKLGYYSIFVNVFLSLYYKGIATTIHDAISLSMFFGLICNGTSALAGVWTCIYENDKAIIKWLNAREYNHKLFDCLMKLYGKCYKNNKENNVLYGNSKLN
jgi:hypothetical protein